MCGIGGIRRLEDDSGHLAPPIESNQIEMLLNSLEYRGNDAAGVALVSLSGEIFVHKNNRPAWEVTGSDDYQNFITEHLNDDILMALVHTRKATKGTPYKNENNHPLIKDAGVCVHNGMISNDDHLFGSLKLERGAETDSDILRAILDAEGGVNKKALKAMSAVSGSVASALVHPSDPTKLMLLRSGNPLVLADDGQKFYFASDKRAIYRAARPWIKRHGVYMQLQSPNLAFLTMPNDSGWIQGPRGLEWHDKFTASAIRYRGYQNYSDVYSPARRAVKRFVQPAKPAMVELPVVNGTPESEREFRDRVALDYTLVDFVRCPNSECSTMMSMTQEDRRRPLSRFQCVKCDTNLAGAMVSHHSLPKAGASTATVH